MRKSINLIDIVRYCNNHIADTLRVKWKQFYPDCSYKIKFLYSKINNENNTVFSVFKAEKLKKFTIYSSPDKKSN